MNRREVIQSLGALPFFTLKVAGKEVSAVKPSSGGYVVFADPRVFDFDVLNNLNLEEGNPLEGSIWFVVRPLPGQTVQDSIAIYKLDE